MFLLISVLLLESFIHLNENEQSPPSECPSIPKDAIDLSTTQTYDYNNDLYGCNSNLQRVNGTKCIVHIYLCTFKDLKDSSNEGGGAIYLNPTSKNTPTGNLTVDGCTFERCQSTTKGGAIMISTAQVIRYFLISNCKFNNNEATEEGGSICFMGSTGDIIKCEFNNNKGSTGSDIYYYLKEGNPTKELQMLTISDNKFGRTDSTITSAFIKMAWTTGKSKILFENNEINIGKDNSNSYLIDFEGSIEPSRMQFTNNCILPSNDHLSTNEELKTSISSGFSNSCETTEPTTKPTDPSKPTTEPTTKPTTEPTDPSKPTTEPTTKPTTEPTDPSKPTTKPTDPLPPNGCPTPPNNAINLSASEEYTTNQNLYGCNSILPRINGTKNIVYVYSCIFRNLVDSGSQGGGAIYLTTTNKNTPTGFCTIIGCNFEGCKSNSNGGAIMISTAQITRNFIIFQNIFKNNEAEESGGAICFIAVLANISECQFINNKAATGGEISYKCNGNPTKDEQLLTIFNNTFERTNSAITASLINFTWVDGSSIIFENNEIKIQKTDVYLIDFDGNTEVGTMKFIDNCILPSNDYLTKNQELMKKISSGFSNSCGTTIPDETSPEEAKPSYTPNPSPTPQFEQIKVDSSLKFTGSEIEINKDGYKADNEEVVVKDKEEDIILIRSQSDSKSIVVTTTTTEKQEKPIFISPSAKDSEVVIKKPSNENEDFGLSEIGVHANANLKEISLPEEAIPLNIFSDDESEVSLVVNKIQSNKTISLNHLIMNNGSIQLNVPSEIESIEFKIVDVYQNEQIKTLNKNNEMIETNINELRMYSGSKVTLTNASISSSIKSKSRSTLRIEGRGSFDQNSNIEMTESSFIDFGSSLIEGVCNEIKLLESEPSLSKVLNDENIVILMCGTNFNCSEWKGQFVGNDQYSNAKCISNFNNQVCLAASDKSEYVIKNVTKKPLSAGAIAGIAIVIGALVIAVIVLVVLYIKSNSTKVKDDSNNEIYENNKDEMPDLSYNENANINNFDLSDQDVSTIYV